MSAGSLPVEIFSRSNLAIDVPFLSVCCVAGNVGIALKQKRIKKRLCTLQRQHIYFVHYHR